jgi:HK97 family phage prohead protease
MTDIQFRSLAGADMEVRDGRTVVGILVPWDTPQRISADLIEGFRHGAFDRQIKAPNRVPFARGHLGPNGTMGGDALGRITLLRNDAHGLYGEARVSETPDGDKLLTLLRDGVFEELSIGFVPRQNEFVNGVTWRKSAQLTEVAVVVAGAYGDGAKVLAVREQDETAALAAYYERRAEALAAYQEAQRTIERIRGQAS